MAIFGRSKKSKTTTSHLQSPPNASIPQLSQPARYPTRPQNDWQQYPTPYTSYGNEAGPSQSLTLPPGSQGSQPVFALQHDHEASFLPQRLQSCPITSLAVASVTNLITAAMPEYNEGPQHCNHRAVLDDLILSKLNSIITLIDGERFSGDERELVIYPPPQPLWQQQQEPASTSRELSKGKSKGMTNNAVSTSLSNRNYFAKVHLYANSRLPPNLPPMKLYIPTFPLLCLAAQYSERVYTKPAGQERETLVEGSWRSGTKAMVIKSVPMDDVNTIVFAIRGTQSFSDWAVNFNTAPASPEGFLDDPGNCCHAGFLTVAKKMVKTVAARLRTLLQEDPSRASYSLLITGHSAGGAIAALLYSHMLATSREAASELNILTGCFKRIHCITFGAPPVSLLPLSKPSNPALRKSLFLSFVNEGDPVARADLQYMRSLLDLLSSPAPGPCYIETVATQKIQPLLQGVKKSSSSMALQKVRPPPTSSKTVPVQKSAPLWPVPEASLSNAGRIVLLRSVERYEATKDKKKKVQNQMDDGVVAQMISDDLLRGVIWGDPMCHIMKLYARRIEILATNAVMGRAG